MNDPAIVSLTPRGLELGQRLLQLLEHGELITVEGSARAILEGLFQSGRPLVCIMALGIVVRLLGPLTRDKTTDSPVVVVDEGGRFAISVLGGHAGGANSLAQQVARLLSATAVVTTASDVLGLPAVDLIGQELGWKIDGTEALTKLAAAVIRRRPIAVWQEAGRRDWYTPFGQWPTTFHRIEQWPAAGDWSGMVAISDRQLEPGGCWPTVFYRPPSLTLGIGCRRGVPGAEIQALFEEVCRSWRLSPLSLGQVATATLKADEPGLQEFAQLHRVPLCSFSLPELQRRGPLPTPSAMVRSKIGVPGVAEPAAMLAAGTTQLLVPKQCAKRVTMAVARREGV